MCPQRAIFLTHPHFVHTSRTGRLRKSLVEAESKPLVSIGVGRGTPQFELGGAQVIFGEVALIALNSLILPTNGTNARKYFKE